jgi:DNA repair ATPase RecN
MGSEIILFGVALVMMTMATVIYVVKDKDNYQLLTNKCVELERGLKETESRASSAMSVAMKYKADIDMVQEHCAKIREQQQLLHKRQNFLKAKMIPNKIELTIAKGNAKPLDKIEVELTKGNVGPLMQKINKQLDGLSQ